MLAFHNTLVTKDEILTQLEAHARADEIVKNQYWKNGKGCAIGCTIHSSDHYEYEPRFGIPQMLARLEDCIFEGLPNGKAKDWPLRFMRAIQPGSDLSRIGWKFLYWLLTDKKINPGIDHPEVKNAVKQCAEIIMSLADGNLLDRSAARSAESAAWSAASAESAESAAWCAAWCAKSAASAACSAASAAWSAESAESAASAAWSAASAASAESVESAAESVESAAWSAESAAWELMADKLIELINAGSK